MSDANYRWQGSIYKILWRQVLMYFITYIALGLIYKLALSEEDQRYFIIKHEKNGFILFY